MIKVAELVKRPAGMTLEDFRAHWREKHGPIVAQVPGLRRYVQSHPLLGGYRKGELVYDGLAELWFDHKDDLAAIAGTKEFSAAKADEPNFSDGDQLVELVCDEQVIKHMTPPAHAIKNVELLTFRPDLDPLEAQRYWREEHGPLAAAIPQMTRYVQSHLRPGAYRDGRRPRWDGIAISWFESIDAMRQAATTPELAATRADEANFLAPGLPPVMLTEEIVIVDRT